MMRKMIFVLLFASVFGIACGETYTWTGLGSSGDWNDADNWSSSSSGVPNVGDTAVFTTAATITSAIVLGEGTLSLQLSAGVTNIFSPLQP